MKVKSSAIMAEKRFLATQEHAPQIERRLNLLLVPLEILGQKVLLKTLVINPSSHVPREQPQPTHSLHRQSVPPCVQQRNHFDGVCPLVQDRHGGGVQLGPCEEVRSVMFMCVTNGTEWCCVVCSVDFV